MNQKVPPMAMRTDKIGREWLAFILRENGYSPVWDDNYKHGVKFRDDGETNGDNDGRSSSVQMETDSKVCRGVDFSYNRTSSLGGAEVNKYTEKGRSMGMDASMYGEVDDDGRFEGDEGTEEDNSGVSRYGR